LFAAIFGAGAVGGFGVGLLAANIATDGDFADPYSALFLIAAALTLMWICFRGWRDEGSQ
jgi:hypothetical protein